VSDNYFPFLPRKQAEIVYLALVEGLTNEEIARRKGISYGAVSVALSRACKATGARTSRQGLARLLLMSVLANGHLLTWQE